MTIQVKGVLKDPLGNPVETQVRITQAWCKGSLAGLQGVINTNSEGNYAFSLENGKYLVDILQNDEYTMPVLVSVTVDTASPITLAALLDQADTQCPKVPNEV